MNSRLTRTKNSVQLDRYASLKRELRTSSKQLKKTYLDIPTIANSLGFNGWVRTQLVKPTTGKWLITTADVKNAFNFSEGSFTIQRIRLFLDPTTINESSGGVSNRLILRASLYEAPVGDGTKVYIDTGRVGASPAVIDVELGRLWRESKFSLDTATSIPINNIGEITFAAYGDTEAGSILADFLVVGNCDNLQTIS
jgi:hypothetical protein